jgi:hypothetical protein
MVDPCTSSRLGLVSREGIAQVGLGAVQKRGTRKGVYRRGVEDEIWRRRNTAQRDTAPFLDYTVYK